MGKKKGGKRLGKKQVSELLQNLFQHHPNETFSFKQIFKALKLDTHPLKMLAIDVMEEMAWDDFLSKVSDSSYRLNMKTQVQEGVFRRKASGRNSFLPDDGGTPVFVAERNSMSAMDGDRVKVSYMARRDKHIKEAMVIEIVRRAHDQIVGKLRVEKDFALLIPQDTNYVHDIIIPKRKLKGGKTDDKAVVKVTQWPDSEHKNITGSVVDILGRTGDNTAEMHAILAQYNLPYKYPKNVEEAAEKIDATITQQEIDRREDFRDVFTCTIDPKDAKDFDDALSIRKLDSGLWEVGVHIADVSHYVKEGSVIDKEAYARATSIYLVDRTIPMLPERLCNFICSLRPDEEKLCYSVIFVLDDEANIKKWHLAHTVIRSNRRYAYEEVQQVLEDNGVATDSGNLTPHSALLPPRKNQKGENALELCVLDALAKKLRAARFKNGSVKFDREELHFDIDETGKPIRAYFKVSKDANKLIEEFMLLANKTVAESIGRVKKGQKAKTLPYRIHDQPDPTKLENLRQFVSKFGYKVKTSGTKGAITRSLNALLADAEGGRDPLVLGELLRLRILKLVHERVAQIGRRAVGRTHKHEDGERVAYARIVGSGVALLNLLEHLLRDVRVLVVGIGLGRIGRAVEETRSELLVDHGERGRRNGREDLGQKRREVARLRALQRRRVHVKEHRRLLVRRTRHVGDRRVDICEKRDLIFVGQLLHQRCHLRRSVLDLGNLAAGFRKRDRLVLGNQRACQRHRDSYD